LNAEVVKKKIPYNRTSQCRRCQSIVIPHAQEGINNEEGEEIEQIRIQLSGMEYRYNRINERNQDITNQGFIDSIKDAKNVRFLSLNTRGFGPSQMEKVNMMKQAIVDYELDVLLLNETNRRWSSSQLNQVKRLFKSISKNVQLHKSDSGENARASSGYLPGGTLTMLTGKSAGMTVESKHKSSQIGQWNSVRLEGGGEKLQIINLYRIPESTAKGILKSKAQYDRVSGEIKTTKEYRENVLEEISKEIKLLQHEGVNGIILAGDFNQDIGSDRIQRFLCENGLYEVHREVNECEEQVRDKTYQSGSNQLDAVFVTRKVLRSIKGSKLVDFNDIILSDHRGFIFDMDFEEYFNLNPSRYDRSKTRKLNPNNRKHRIQFKEKLDEYIDQLGLIQRAESVCLGNPTIEELNLLDENITYVMNAARRYVEGVQRNVPYSKLKQKLESTMKYLKGLIQKKKGKLIDEGALEKRKQYCQVDYEDEDLPALEDRYTEAVEEWKDFKKEALKQKEESLLELYPTELAGDSEEIKRRRAKVIKNIKNAQFRQRTFDLLTKGVGKGEKRSLTKVRTVDNNGNVAQEMQDRESIEEAIATYNKEHFRQAYSSKAYKDRIYHKLKLDQVRDKILQGEIEVEACDYEDVHDFLKLLKNQNAVNKQWEEISISEWERVVKNSKRKSASSIFSNRTYSVYKCALDSEKLTRILVLLYNTVISKGYYLKRWLKVLDVILEKGKGPVIGKLRTIQLIEADLQLLMRIFIGSRNNKNIELDERLSKYNYGSRSGYSIEDAILEKRLMYDVAVRSGEPMMHNISDLKACYDRQLPNIGCLVEESVGVDRNAAKMFAKVLPIMQHHVCTDFGISENAYGSRIESLGGTGQGNSVSGAICRDTSCLIFKYLENKRLGAVFNTPLSQKLLQRLAIAFVDDTDFYTNGHDFERKMQMIMDLYTKLYEATGGKIQQTKILFYCWQWVYKNGKQVIHQIEAELTVHGEKINAISVSESTRTLGVYLNPSLTWGGQFEVMRSKLTKSITKLMNLDINSYQASVYYHIYMIKEVFFGCGIVDLHPREEQELKRIYEAPLLQKLGLSKKFPRAVMYARKSALGLGIMAPSTILALLKLKLYIGNKRINGNAGEAINAQEEFLKIEAGRRVNLGEDPSNRYWKTTWIDEVGDELWKRNIKLVSPEDEEGGISKNKTVMSYAMEYVEQKNLEEEVLYQINYVRLKKQVLLPFELVGFKGKRQTSCYRNILESSPIKWMMCKNINEGISICQKRLWEEFLAWLRTKTVETIIDFERQWKWTCSEDESVIVREVNGVLYQYVKVNEHVNRYECNGLTTVEEEEFGCVGYQNNDGSISLIECVNRIPNVPVETDSNDEINPELIQAIQCRRAVAASDASIRGDLLATHWIITTLLNDVKEEGGITTDAWGDGMIPAGEGVGLLDLVMKIVKATKLLSSGGIVIYNDNKKLIRHINRDQTKASECTLEAGAVVERIRRVISRASIEITIEYANDKPRVDRLFEQQPGEVLMRLCDIKSKEKCLELECNGGESNIKHVGILTPVINGRMFDKNINVLIRECDAKVKENEIIEENVGAKSEWVDKEARNCFAGGVGVSTLKCVAGYNHHGCRNNKINSGLIDNKCPICGEIEDWKHIVRCQGIDQMKEAYLIDLENELKKVKGVHQERETVNHILSDINTYIKNNNEELVTTQQLIGMDLIFKGWVMKNWLNVNQCQSVVMKNVNRIIVRKSVQFYSKAWMNRNELLHDEQKYRPHVIEWYERIRSAILNGNKPEMKKYLRAQELDVSRCSSSYIRMWNMGATELMRRVPEERMQDIRMFFRQSNS